MAITETKRSSSLEQWRLDTNATALNLGDLATLSTSSKTSVVSAINEINSSKINKAGDTFSGNVAVNGTLIVKEDVSLQKSLDVAGSIKTASWAGQPIDISKGGTGLTSIGASNRFLAVNGAGTSFEYKSISAGAGITIENTSGNLKITSSAALVSGATNDGDYLVGKHLLTGSWNGTSHNTVNTTTVFEVRLPNSSAGVLDATVTKIVGVKKTNGANDPDIFSIDKSGNVAVTQNLNIAGTTSLSTTNISGNLVQTGATSIQTGSGGITTSGNVNVGMGGKFVIASVGNIQGVNATPFGPMTTGTLDTFDKTKVRCAEYFIRVDQASSYACYKFYVVHDGTTVYITETGTVSTSLTSQFSLDATISGDNVNVTWNGSGSACNVRWCGTKL